MRKAKKRGGYPKLSDSEKEQIVQDYQSKSLKELSKEYSCSISTIARVIMKQEGKMHSHVCTCGTQFYAEPECKA